jgi:hypothetical protein
MPLREQRSAGSVKSGIPLLKRTRHTCGSVKYAGDGEPIVTTVTYLGRNKPREEVTVTLMLPI